MESRVIYSNDVGIILVDEELIYLSFVQNAPRIDDNVVIAEPSSAVGVYLTIKKAEQLASSILEAVKIAKTQDK